MFALKLSVFSLVLFTEPPFALRMPPQILTWKTGWHKLHFWFKNLTTKIRRDRRGLQSQAGYYWQKSKPFLQHWWVNHLWRGDIFLLDFYLIWSFYQGNPAALPRLLTNFHYQHWQLFFSPFCCGNWGSPVALTWKAANLYSQKAIQVPHFCHSLPLFLKIRAS